MHVEHAAGDDRASVETSASPTRWGRSVSEAIVSRLVTGFDAIAVFGAGVAAIHWDRSAVDWRLNGLVVLLGAVLGVNFLHLAGAHRFDQFGDLGAAIGRALLGWLLTLATLFLATFLIEPLMATNGTWVALWFSGGVVLLVTGRVALQRQVRDVEPRRPAGRGGGDRRRRTGGATAAARHERDPRRPPHLRRLRRRRGPPAAALHGTCHPGLDRRTAARRARPWNRHRHRGVASASERLLVETLNKLSLLPVDVRLCPGEFAMRLGTLQASHIGGHTFLNVIDQPLRDWRSIAKTVEDRILGALILTLIAPLMVAIALLIRLDSPGPALFRQKRYGFNNQLIEVLKFRTMYQEMSDSNAERLTQRNDPRITRVGAFLRRTSLDELPQFLNVLRGDMSIVGPRPHALSAKAGTLLYQEAVKYYDARHRMKPGITGWAQVNGWRGETDTLEQIRKRVEHDLYYIEHWSIAFDLWIVARTIVGGFSGRNAF